MLAAQIVPLARGALDLLGYDALDHSTLWLLVLALSKALGVSVRKSSPACHRPTAEPDRVGPFLKESVKRKRSPSGFFRNGSAWRGYVLACVHGRVNDSDGCGCHCFGVFVSVVVASLREVAIVLFSGDCSQHIPSRGTAHDSREQLCLVIGRGRCVFIWCEFLAVRATPYRASCGLPWRFLAEAPHPRSDSSWPKREGSQVAMQPGSNNRPNLGSSSLLSFRCNWRSLSHGTM